MDGIFVGHHERTGASLFLSERGLLRGMRVQRKAMEAIVRTPQQRRWYILKQDVARYGPTPGCEACVALAGGAQRVTKPHSDECRARLDELMQRDEDAPVQQRLHADSLRPASRE